MKKKALSSVTIVALGILTIIISGCATGRVNLTDTGIVTIEQHAPGKVRIAWSDAYEDENGFVVTGVLRRHDLVGMPIKTHVNVMVFSPDGNILDEARSQDIYVPRRRIGRGQSFQRFRVNFPTIPAEGSTISITTHTSTHSDTEKT